MASLKYIITGTGRCGTVYFAKLLTSIGITCGHETIFSYDGLDKAKARMNATDPLEVSVISQLASATEVWFPEGISDIRADSSYMAAPFLADPMFANTKILHVVRKPMEVINSFVHGLGYFKNDCLIKEDFLDYHKFIYSHVPTIQNYKNPIDRAAAYYIEWNNMIEKNAEGRPYLRHNINRNLNAVFDFLEVKRPKNYYDKVKTNHILGLKPILVQFSQIPSPDVREQLLNLHKRYFYIKM